MARTPKLLDFTLPARDFGHLYDTKNTLESQFAGVSNVQLGQIACWHVVEPRTMTCVHCYALERWIVAQNHRPIHKANAALLLRLRQFFAALGPDDQPDEWWTSGEKPDPTESMHIRVILMPVAQLEVKKAPPAGILEDLRANQGKIVPLPTLAATDAITSKPKLFGETSRPDLYPPFSQDPNGSIELESGCMCLAERRRASSVYDLARLAGSVHPLCPIHGKDAKKLNGTSRAFPSVAQITDQMAEAFPEEAAAAGYIPEGKGTVDGEVIDPISVQRAIKAGEWVQQLTGQIIEIDEVTDTPEGYLLTCPDVQMVVEEGKDVTVVRTAYDPALDRIADVCVKCLCHKDACVCGKQALDAIIDAAVDPNATVDDLAKAFDDADRIIEQAAYRVAHPIEFCPKCTKAMGGPNCYCDQSAAERLAAAKQPEPFCRNCVKPVSNCDCGPLPDAPCPHCGEDADCRCEAPTPPSPWE